MTILGKYPQNTDMYELCYFEIFFFFILLFASIYCYIRLTLPKWLQPYGVELGKGFQ